MIGYVLKETNQKSSAYTECQNQEIISMPTLKMEKDNSYINKI